MNEAIKPLREELNCLFEVVSSFGLGKSNKAVIYIKGNHLTQHLLKTSFKVSFSLQHTELHVFLLTVCMQEYMGVKEEF